MEKEKTLTVTLDEAREWYIKGGELKAVALKCFSEEELNILPKTWEECFKKLSKGEYIDIDSSIEETAFSSYQNDEDKNVVPLGLGKPMLALMQLLVCREVYRNGWKPDWNSDSYKYTIECNSGDIMQSIISKRYSKILSFQSEKVRDEFLKNFRDLILEAKELV